MTKKDYELIASAIARCIHAPGSDDEAHENAVMYRVTLSIARELEAQNDRFNKSRFMQACGWPSWYSASHKGESSRSHA